MAKVEKRHRVRTAEAMRLPGHSAGWVETGAGDVNPMADRVALAIAEAEIEAGQAHINGMYKLLGLTPEKVMGLLKQLPGMKPAK